jgi:hypothetical protein
VSFKCTQEVIPFRLYENILDFGYGLEKIKALWLGLVQLPSLSGRNHGVQSIYVVDDAVNVNLLILKPILVHVVNPPFKL